MRSAWVVAAVLALTAALAPSPETVDSNLVPRDVTFSSHSFTLHGTVWAPSHTSGPLPGIVLVHGSGPGPRAKYQLEAETFAQAGIVTLAYDKRTVGYSQLSRDYSVLADDALAGLELLRSSPGVDGSSVGLWGESEGSWVVPLAAARSFDVAFAVLVGASGVSPARQQAWYLDNLFRHRGIRGSFLTAASTTYVRFLVGAGLFAEANFDMVPSLRRLHHPVLALWSTIDYNHPPAEASEIIANALDEAGNTHYTIRFIDGAAPDLHRSTDGYDRLADLAPGYAELVATWVHEVADGNAPGTSVERAPRQDRPSQALIPLGWYESVWIQLAAALLLVVSFAGYLTLGVARRFRGRRRMAVAGWPARMVAIIGLLVPLALPPYFFAAPDLLSSGRIIGGRPIVWLGLQSLAVVAVVGAALTIVAWWRNRQVVTSVERLRLALVVTGSVVFAVWAFYWGLLLP
jgi:dienelactone hydrolase